MTQEQPATATAPRRRTARRAVVAAAVCTVILGTAAFAWMAGPSWRLLVALDGVTASQPSRLYGRPLRLAVGGLTGRDRIVEELETLGYGEATAGAEIGVGRYRRTGRLLRIHERRFPTPAGPAEGGLLEVRFAGGRVAGLTIDGAPADVAQLEPPLIAAYLGEERLDRRPLPPGPLPEPLAHAVLAAEDDGFFTHLGVSPAGIARAAWVNLRRGEVRQGGSTLTQQLVKNLALSSERTLARKAREAVLAVLLELRWSKQRILRAYLDTAFLGSRDGANLSGVGAASRAYFGRDPDQLTLAEAATLAGMLAAPAHTSPVDEPGRARARRDWVLGRMVELGWADEASARAAMAEPVAAAPAPVAPQLAPYFAAAVRREALDRLGVDDLESAGLVLLSALDWRDQRAAQEAVEDGLAAVESRRSRRQRGSLQAALVSLDPRDGAVLAWSGGRSWRESQFDRVGQARRQAGSAFKPIVYATAIEAGLIAPATIVEDEPLTVRTAGRLWEPRNDDGGFLGRISARAALEQSRNLPAARLALAAGLEDVVATARRMGIASRLEPVPALALGAFEVSPLELASAYATLAASGIHRPARLLTGALDGAGRPLPLAVPEASRALRPSTAYLVTDMLRGVLDRGTAAAVREMGVDGPLAGKTGTSNAGRDGWFAGYSADRVTVVWVGRDDDGAALLSGARAALPVWARFTRAVRPPGGFEPIVASGDVVTAYVDPATGELATSRCPEVAAELFAAEHVPVAQCHEHGGWLAVPVSQPDGVPVEKPGRFRRWLARLFGGRAAAI